MSILAKPPNFHTHVGRPVIDKDGRPVWARVPSIHGKGRYRVKVEYVPVFADPEMTARVIVRAAARKAWLDARRARFAPMLRSTGVPMSDRQRAHNYYV